MNADTYPLSTIFGKDIRYVVPLFQRPYVWEQGSHWEPLWEDVQTVVGHLMYFDGIAALAPAGTPPILTPPHFLGAIVLDISPFATGSLEERYVIDGQQRLATLQLFIAAASDVAVKHTCDKEARLLRKLTENDPDLVAHPDDQFKVWPTNVNRAPFRSAMLRTDANGQSGLIQQAYTYFVGAIDDWANEASNADDVTVQFVALTKVVRDLLKLVVIDLEPGDNAQVIFETLNARGMPLLAIDLVKNLVFQRASIVPGVDLDDLYEKRWKPFDEEYWREEVRQGRLNRPRAELFLMHWLTMQRVEEVGAHHLFATFRQLMDEQSTPVVDTIREFASDAAIFRGFESQPTGSVERQFFDRLDVLDTTTALPIALLLFRQPPSAFPLQRRHRALALLESWMVRRMICRLTTKNYNRFFLDILKALKANQTAADDVLLEQLRAVDAPTRVWPSDKQVTEVLVGSALYGQINQRRVVMLLSAVERAMRTNKTEDVALPAKLTVEHLLPQKWAKHWPLDPPDDPLAIAERDRHVHRLGNLTLVTAEYNSSVSNFGWPVKREELKRHSVLLLNSRVASEHPELWNETTIDARSKQLADHITRIWPGPDSSSWG